MMFPSWWCHLLTIISVLAMSIAINRPVYKVILNSKGYAQFIQYDVNVPSLREFTLCVWVRVTSLESDQSIFTYLGTDDKRIMRLWLDEGGRQLRISLEHDRVTSSADVEFTAGVWRDVCLSYQADHGAWALYVDAALVLCEGSPKFRGFEFPGEGSLIFGYGTSEKGFPTGLSGEIYGTSMILLSTIERNITMNMVPWKRKKLVQKNRITDRENQYIVLGDLQSDEEQTAKSLTNNKEYEIFSHDYTVYKLPNNITLSRHPLNDAVSNEMSIHESPVIGRFNKNEKFINQHTFINKLNKNASFKVYHEFKKELAGSGTQDLPIVLEYETPPPITASTADYSTKNTEERNKINKIQHENFAISDVDTPPPPEHNPKVYGQWGGSKFASNVLNYLKSIDFNPIKAKQRNVMPTFTRGKLTDSYPYPSEFTYDIIRPPIKYKKRKFNAEMRHTIIRRNTAGPEINVQIIKPDENDIVPYKVPNPKLVEVTNRGEAKTEVNNKLHMSMEDNTYASKETSISHNSFKTRPLPYTLNIFDRHRGSNLLDILPFLKPKDYFVNNGYNQTKSIDSNQVNLSNNKKHTGKIHNSEYVQNFDLQYNHKSTVDVPDRNFSLEIKPKPALYKQMLASNGESIMIGRALAKEVSNQAKQNIYNIPLLKFKHGVLPSSDYKMSSANNIITEMAIDNNEDKETNNQNHFNKQIKLGNALNEKFIVNFSDEQIKNTFLGGDDKIPDINRHRSKWNSNKENIPASLQARVCNNIELYVHEDGSITRSKIKSPVQRRNIGIEFIVQNYKKCSMNESSLRGSSLVLIDWIKTPVKLFGGAYVKKTKDLCGFF